MKQFLNGATPETVAEVEVLAAGIREHYQPVGMLEELLLQVVVEAARCDRVLGFEQQFTGSPIQIVACLGHVVRYSTSTSHALYRAIQELERVQAARKAREGSAASPAPESALPITVEEQSASQVENTAVSETSAAEGPFPPGVFRAVTYRVTG